MSRVLAVVCCLTLAACGGGAGPSGTDSQAADGPTSTDGTAVPATSAPSTEGGVAQGDGPVLTEAPDPCRYLTQADAEALLGAPTGPGASLDAGGWNCVYDTGQPRRRLVLDMQVGRDRSVDGTQTGMSIQACGGEVVERFDDLGLDAALYRNTAEHCGAGGFLWVVTGATFRGRLRGAEHEMAGPLHFTVTLSPWDPERESETVALLRQAAGRVVAELSR